MPMALRNLGEMRRRGEWPEGADAERSGGQHDRGSAADGPGPVSGSPGGSAGSAGSASDRTGPAAGGRPGSAPEGPGPAPEGPGSAPEGTASGAGRPGTSPGTPGRHPGVSGAAPEDPGPLSDRSGPVPDDAGRAPGGGGAVSGGAAGGGRPGASSGPARGEEGPHGGPDRVPGRSVPAPAAGEPARPEDELISPDPLPPTVSRRGAIAFVGGGSLLLAATTVGHSFDAPVRETALLAPHGGPEPGSGPGAFQINKTAASRGIDPKETGADAWRLVVAGNGRTVRLSRAQLQELPLHGSALPIACVEGWSTSDQAWRGVRLRDLAELVGYDTDTAPDVVVESLQRAGAFRVAALRYNQVRDPLSLLALSVNGADLTPDHGYPARIIVPAAPGVLNTKWVSRMTFGAL
ncbi:molybdopterin-dependent oxidoreductase [Streptomyces sp. NPDC048674]|uniref:molybdopterin-dependent oxidoreductase n=1 Tax=Streptomyces sp. NPDC048674 TaxID=3155491 RepID=UPI0034472B2C